MQTLENWMPGKSPRTRDEAAEKEHDQQPINAEFLTQQQSPSNKEKERRQQPQKGKSQRGPNKRILPDPQTLSTETNRTRKGEEEHRSPMGLEEEPLSQPKRQKKITEYTQINPPRSNEIREVGGTTPEDVIEHQEDGKKDMNTTEEKPQDKDPMSEAQASNL